MPSAPEMNVSMPCTNESVAAGMCHGMHVCGYCYDMGLHRTISRPYELYNLFLIGGLLPFVGCLGLIGNTLSAFIYSRTSMRSSTNTYLCALAVSDITIIVTAFFLFFLESMRKRSAVASRYFALFTPVTFPLGLTAQSLSVFLTIVAAFDCFILVAGGDTVRQRVCRPSTAKRLIAGAVATAVLFNLPHWFEVYVLHCWSIPYAEPTFDVCPTSLRLSEGYYTFYYAYLYTIVMAVGPVLLLIVLNAIIIIVLRNSRNGEQSDSDILTLVLVVCLFIACNILPLSVNFLELLFNVVNTYMIDLSNLMVVVNSSCNFLIYYAFGSQFRRTLKQYVKSFAKKKRTLKFATEVIAIDFVPEEDKVVNALLNGKTDL